MKLKQFLWILSFLFLLVSCNYRTPSKVRFERMTGVTLPDSINVIQDRFEEVGPDYGLFYEFKIRERDFFEIFNTVNNSKDWNKTKNEWQFQKTNDGIIYYISFSKDKCKIIYTEELI